MLKTSSNYMLLLMCRKEILWFEIFYVSEYSLRFNIKIVLSTYLINTDYYNMTLYN